MRAVDAYKMGADKAVLFYVSTWCPEMREVTLLFTLKGKGGVSNGSLQIFSFEQFSRCPWQSVLPI